MRLDVCGGSSLRALHNVAQDTMAMTMNMFKMNQAVFVILCNKLFQTSSNASEQWTTLLSIAYCFSPNPAVIIAIRYCEDSNNFMKKKNSSSTAMWWVSYEVAE